MKIYHKKLFLSGVFMAALATVNGIADIVNHTVDINGIIWIIALYLFGLEAVIHSLSQKRIKQDKLEELDERNQLITLKSKSKAFGLTQIISFFLMFFLLAMGKVSNNQGFIIMGVGLAFVFVISMFTELFTYLYYESKN